MYWGPQGGAGYQHLESFTRGRPQLFHGTSKPPFKKGDDERMKLAVDTFFQKLAALQDSQPDVWTIFEEQTNFADRMEHEDGFDPCNGMPGSNIRFRLIKYWVNLYLNKRSLFGGAGAKGRAFRGWR